MQDKIDRTRETADFKRILANADEIVLAGTFGAASSLKKACDVKPLASFVGCLCITPTSALALRIAVLSVQIRKPARINAVDEQDPKHLL